jgi:hypothetical protein
MADLKIDVRDEPYVNGPGARKALLTTTLDRIRRLVATVRAGLRAGLAPRLADEGTSGSYFLRDERKAFVAIFKPLDEEAYAPHNPRGFVGNLGQESIVHGFVSGEAHVREVIAYVLDFGRFAGVPPTIRATLAHPSFNYGGGTVHKKVGSLQEFVAEAEAAQDFSNSVFSDFEVQKVALLDLKILNMDRNDLNILVKSPGRILCPIDHGFCLPDDLNINRDSWEWYRWPQVRIFLLP